MKSRTSIVRPLAYLAVVPAIAALVGMQLGCEKLMFWRSKPQEMHSAAGIPAGEGTVRVSTADNGNTKVALRVKHLAPPSKIAPDTTVYIVWIQPQGGDKQNVGALVLNKDLEGSLDTLTPHHRFLISVTPEPNSQAAQPSHEPVFSYSVESNK